MSQTIVVNSAFNKTFIVDLNSNYTLDNNPLQQTNLAVIENMLLNVILTSPGERPFNPQFGSGVPELLFNNITTQNAYTILQNIFFSVSKFIPEITINTGSSKVYASYIPATYYIILSYTVTSLPGNITSTLSLSPLQ
jgi:phage baseplate assembly protein W